MKFRRLSTTYCCGSFAFFLGAVEHRLNFAYNDAPVWLCFNITAGFHEAEFYFCPFCGAKIECIAESLGVAL